MGIFLTVGFLVFFVTEGRIIIGMIGRKSAQCSWIIILGAQVHGRVITDSLFRRLEKAIDYLEMHPKTKVIVSGGQGKGEDISEAKAMEEYLLARGIKKERIFLEAESKTTQENLKFSARYIETHKDHVGIVSNNFHLYRACQYARNQGYSNPYPIAAGCHPVLFVNYMVREFFAVWKMWVYMVKNSWLTKNKTVL